MTVKVAGCWERGWDTPWQEFNWWVHPLKEFGVNEFCMMPVTGIAKGAVKEYDFIDTLVEDNSTLVHIYVDEQATVSLPDFVHPEDALYIVGKTGYSPYKTNYREGIDIAVKIPSLTNEGGFWGHQAITMILYDRYLKSL